jgi:YVTN family beta-propeller protein
MRRLAVLLFAGVLFCLSPLPSRAQNNSLTTIAGEGSNVGPATSAYLPQPEVAVRDAFGNTYISVGSPPQVFKVNPQGNMSVYAGSATPYPNYADPSFLGDGAPAISAHLIFPTGLALDANANLFIADQFSGRIRRVDALTGIITTVAGSGPVLSSGSAGDGGPATSARLLSPGAVAVDASGNLFIAETNAGVIRKVDNSAQHVITTYMALPAGDLSMAVAVDSHDNLFVAASNDEVFKVDNTPQHNLSVYAGGGSGQDGGPAATAFLGGALGVSVDLSGNLFIADGGNVRKVDTSATHIISTVAGTGAPCLNSSAHCGDGGAATAALLNASAVFVDSTGALLITDFGALRVREVAAGNNPTISTVAGGGSGGDGGAAIDATVGIQTAVLSDSLGNVYFGDINRVRRIDAVSHIVTTVAGNGYTEAFGSSNGDGGLASNGNLNFPLALALDTSGNLYIATFFEVRRVDAQTKIITTVAGSNSGLAFCAQGEPIFPACGDGGPAASAALGTQTFGLAVDSHGNIFIADVSLGRVRRVDANTKVITNFAGTPGSSGSLTGLGGPAASATLGLPYGIAFDPHDNLYVADLGLSRVFKIDNTPEHILTSVAFNGQSEYGGDGGPATAASSFGPVDIAVDAASNLYVWGGTNNLVRRVDSATGTVTTIVGDVNNLQGGYSADGTASIGALINSSLNFFAGVAVDGNQNLYFLDSSLIRKVHMVPAANVVGSFSAFTPTMPGATSSIQNVSIFNTGLADLSVTNIASSNQDFFVAQACPSVVPPGSQFGAPGCQIEVQLKPPIGAAPGAVSGSLGAATTDPARPSISLPLSGTVAPLVLPVLTVTKAGNGAGTVVSVPAGINCGAACSASFTMGATVVLTATQTSGSTFSGWSGACTNASGPCTVTMSSAKSVTAIFTTISSTPPGGPFAYVGSAPATCCSLAVIDTQSNLVIGSIPIGGLSYPFGISPDQRRLYVAIGSAVAVIDTSTNTLVGTITGVGPGANAVIIAPNGKFGYTGNGSTNGSGSISVFSTTSNNVVATIPLPFAGGGVTLTPDGSLLYVGGVGSVIAVIDTGTNTIKSTFSISVPTAGFNGNSAPIFNSTGTFGYVAQDVASVGPGTVSVISVPNNQVVATIQVGTQPEDVVLTPDGAYAYVTNVGSNSVSVIATSTNTVVATVPVGNQPRSIAITPDGESVYVTNLASSTVSVIHTPTNTVVATIPLVSPFGSLIPATVPTSQSITQPLSPTAPNTFNFGPHNFTVQYPAGNSFSNVNMTVVAAQATQQTFKQRIAGTPFANATCIVYSGAGGNCVDYQVTCTSANGGTISCPSESSPTISVKTSFDTLQQIINPGFLTTPIGQNNWTNIFESFYLQRIDPTMKGRTRGFSEFVAVDLGAANPQGAGTATTLTPLASTDERIFPSGSTIPVQFHLISIAHPGTNVTDATAGISVVQVSDSKGNATAKIVLDAPTGFRYSGGVYQYSLTMTGYAAGTYALTIYGNAFAAQQIQFTVPSATTGAQLSTTLQSLILNSAKTQYVAVLKITNTGPAAANGVLATASALNAVATATALPLGVGDISAGQSTTMTINYPISAGAQNSRAALTVSLAYAGGSSGVGLRVALP